MFYLQLATETQLADRARLEQRIEELELITRTVSNFILEITLPDFIIIW